MSSLSTTTILQTLKKNNIQIVTKSLFVQLFGIQNEQTVYKRLQRLTRTGILSRVTKGQYLVEGATNHDFVLANSAYQPSYVSLESALSYYGILSQFAYVISSITTKKSFTFEYQKSFEYTHIDPQLYWGYTKDNNFIIAQPEKALVDMCYLCSKGLRTLSIEELDLSKIKKNIFRSYAEKIVAPQFQKYIREHSLI